MQVNLPFLYHTVTSKHMSYYFLQCNSTTTKVRFWSDYKPSLAKTTIYLKSPTTLSYQATAHFDVEKTFLYCGEGL